MALISEKVFPVWHEQKHWITGEPHKFKRYRKAYTYKCDNPACGIIFKVRKKRAAKNSKGGILKKHYCSHKCQHKGMEMKSRIVECTHQDCSKTFRKWNCQTKKYCSLECAISMSFLEGSTCSHSECNEPISKNNENGYCPKHRSRASYRKHKAILYKELGNKCVCCGERDLMFLTIDHVNNDGGKFRKQSMAHYQIHRLLRHHRENPGSLQLLCMNCNHAKMRNGGKLYRPNKFTRRSLQQLKLELVA
tara:strand:+ start:188 stop:934 length:747 start_codon:yes stop_codon:yes gene_type:complete